MSITYRIIAIVAVMGTAAVAVSAIATKSTLRLEQAVAEFDGASIRGEATSAVERSVARMFDAAEDLREATTRTEVPPHIKRMEDAAARLAEARSVLRGLDGADGAFRSLDETLEAYRRAMAGVVAAVEARSGAAGGAMLSEDEARATLLAVRERLDAYRDREAAELREKVAGSSALAEESIVLVLSGTAVALLAGIGFSL